MKKITLFLLLLVAGAVNAQIVNIPDVNFKNYLLSDPQINTNSDTEIQVSEAQAVTSLTVGNDILSVEGLEAFTSLTELSIDSPLTALDLSTLQGLTTIHVTMNSSDLSNITLGYLPNLTDIYFEVYNLTSLDLSGVENLEHAYLNLNNISTLQIGYKPYLHNVIVHSQHLTGLDLSQCPALIDIELSIASEGGDTYVNLKNGDTDFTGDYLEILYNSYDIHHCYICIDEGEDAIVDPWNNLNGVLFSTYCDFSPGGNYNTIAGTVKLDADDNGCDTTDVGIPFSSVQISDGTSTGLSLNSNGAYSFFTQAGTFTLTPQFENDYFTANPETVTFADNNNNTATQNFCVTANGVYSDVEVTLVPLLAARPGFDATYKLLYKNKGNQILDGAVIFTYNETVADYISASPDVTLATTGHLNWDYANLLPYESREIVLTLNVNSPQENPAINIGDVLSLTTSITPDIGDETPHDNLFAIRQTVVGSLDPNDITCLEGATVSPEKIGDYLHYNINFENTGTYPAIFIVVKDIIDATKFDISSLVVLNASHPVEARVNGNKVEFYFENINLAENGGKGNVTFKIKSLESLAVNSSVMQKADIFFDYNLPVATNEATTTYALLNTPGFTKDASVKIYPNPVKNIVSISAESAIQSVQLFDVQGRLLEATSVNDVTATLDIAQRAKGIYFIKIATDKGVKVAKLVKE